MNTGQLLAGANDGSWLSRVRLCGGFMHRVSAFECKSRVDTAARLMRERLATTGGGVDSGVFRMCDVDEHVVCKWQAWDSGAVRQKELPECHGAKQAFGFQGAGCRPSIKIATNVQRRATNILHHLSSPASTTRHND